ncbi:MAG: Lrp/AsnC ligand binding domain-containing protein [Candidatus Thorarchaeota archaeon]
MAMVFVFINSELGAEEEVLAALKAIVGVKETAIVYGVYDIVAKVVASSMDEIKTIIHGQIRKIPEVQTTLAMVVVESR